MNINETNSADRDQLQSWIDQDNSKKHAEPESWYTGKGLFSFRYDDTKGAVCYIRLDKEDDLARLYYLFVPNAEVRIAKAILKTIPMCKTVAQQQGLKGLIYDSVSQKLIDFCWRAFGFVPAGGDNYKLEFENV